jgi:hypothetical protein
MTVRELIDLLSQLDGDRNVQLSMNMEYQGDLGFIYDDGDDVVLSDCL